MLCYSYLLTRKKSCQSTRANGRELIGLQCERGEAFEILEARVEWVLAFLQQDIRLQRFHRGKRG